MKFSFCAAVMAVLALAAVTPRATQAQLINTVAGGGSPTTGIGDGGPATSARLGLPAFLALDGNGNLFIADSNNNVVREVFNPSSGSANAGTIITVAGGGSPTTGIGDGGPATSARLNFPTGVALDGNGNLFIADNGNNRVREVFNPNSGSANAGTIVTVAGTGTNGFSGDAGVATSAQLNNPTAVALDGNANMFIVDAGNSRIREVFNPTSGTANAGTIVTLAGTGANGFSGDGGPATSAQLSAPSDVALDGIGNLFIADRSNNRIREIFNPTSGLPNAGMINTVAGGGAPSTGIGDGGPATSALLNGPVGVTVDSNGNVFIADTSNSRIREVFNPASGLPNAGTITTVAGGGFPATGIGDGGPATSARLNFPFGVAVDSNGNVLVADTSNNRVRVVGVPVAQLSATALSFPAQAVGTEDGEQIITLRNNGVVPLSITAAIALSGADSGDFGLLDNCLQTTLSPGATCTIGVTFIPTATGTRTATITIADNAGNSPQSVSLTGTAVAAAPAATLSAASLTFGNQTVGTTSGVQSTTLSNSGTGALSITSIAVSGANSADFPETNTCGASLAAGATCAINVTFKPAASGTRTATITITDNGPASPQSVALNGTGSAAADFTIAAAAGSQTSATVTAGRTASYALAFSLVGGTPSDQFSVTVSCVGAPARATCSGPAAPITVTQATPGTATFTVTTTANAELLPMRWPAPRNPLNNWPVAALSALIAAGLMWMLARGVRQGDRARAGWSRRLAWAAPLVLVLIVAAASAGCAGGQAHRQVTPPAASNGTPAGTYSLVVIATSGNITHTQQLTLTVQ